MPGVLLPLNPGFPDLRAVAHGRLLSVADDGRFHELRIVEEPSFLCRLIIHVAHEINLRRFLLPVNEPVNAAHGARTLSNSPPDMP